MTRKKKFVVWLENKTDRRDDEWVSVWAKTPQQARNNADADWGRFTLGRVQTAQEFKKENGFTA